MSCQTEASISLSKIIEITEAEPASHFDEDLKIHNIAANPSEAYDDDLVLIFPYKISKALKMLRTCEGRVIMLSKNLKEESIIQELISENPQKTFLFVERPRYALKQIIKFFSKRQNELAPGIHASAVIEDSAEIHPSACISALTYIGSNVKIGARVKIYPRVSIGAGTSIGEDTIIHSGTVIEDMISIGKRVIIYSNSVIGADGYSFVTREASNLEKLQRRDFNLKFDRQIQEKIESIGTVIIEDDVEIGSCTTIDRGTIGATKICEGAKIDNLCQIAHNVVIGKDAMIIAKTGIAGSSKIGDRVTMAGSSNCGDGVNIGHDVVVGACSAVNSDLDPLVPVLGEPAIPYGEFMKRQRAIARLPRQQEEFRKLKAKVEDLLKETSHT
jgi:UDP-3-O-[3-hydroxymyristoyl] glucosamine N-acyltransferase